MFSAVQSASCYHSAELVTSAVALNSRRQNNMAIIMLFPLLLIEVSCLLFCVCVSYLAKALVCTPPAPCLISSLIWFDALNTIPSVCSARLVFLTLFVFFYSGAMGALHSPPVEIKLHSPEALWVSPRLLFLLWRTWKIVLIRSRACKWMSSWRKESALLTIITQREAKCMMCAKKPPAAFKIPADCHFLR
jgi:hypothetical protein